MSGLEYSFLTQLSLSSAQYYDEFEKKKADGSTRVIRASTGTLKQVQRWILDHFLNTCMLPDYLHGCIPGRSIATNAEAHIGQDIVVNIDISDFFGSISPEMVARTYKSLGMNAEMIEAFVRLTTHKGSLPQGAPTSPMVANLVALPMDNHLINLPEFYFLKTKIAYTRYVDDISISGPNKLEAFIPKIIGAIENSGFRVNQRKLSIKKPSSRQMVTGFVVNNKSNPPRGFVRKIRQELYYCKKYGIKGHCQRISVDPDVFIKRLRGRIGFVNMVQPDLAISFNETLDGLRLLDDLSSDENLSVEMKAKVSIFETFVRMEKTIEFKYFGEPRIVAPSEIYVSTDGRHMMKGFQIVPKNGWRTFEIGNIEDYSLVDD
jgi:hypothetical protein